GGGGGLAAYDRGSCGRPPPLGIYGGVPADSNGSPIRAALGLLLDRSFGLLPHAPVWLLALAGACAVRRPFGPRAWPLVLVGAAVLAPVLPWRLGWGGRGPPPPFLAPSLPRPPARAPPRGRAPR